MAFLSQINQVNTSPTSPFSFSVSPQPFSTQNPLYNATNLFDFSFQTSLRPSLYEPFGALSFGSSPIVNSSNCNTTSLEYLTSIVAMPHFEDYSPEELRVKQLADRSKGIENKKYKSTMLEDSALEMNSKLQVIMQENTALKKETEKLKQTTTTSDSDKLTISNLQKGMGDSQKKIQEFEKQLKELQKKNRLLEGSFTNADMTTIDLQTVEEILSKVQRACAQLSQKKDEILKEMIKGSHSSESCCKICLDKESNIVFRPCNHLCCCKECSVQVTKCPICRKSVLQKEAIFRC